jgi:hypothetical protein
MLVGVGVVGSPVFDWILNSLDARACIRTMQCSCARTHTSTRANTHARSKRTHVGRDLG